MTIAQSEFLAAVAVDQLNKGKLLADIVLNIARLESGGRLAHNQEPVLSNGTTSAVVAEVGVPVFVFNMLLFPKSVNRDQTLGVPSP